ncbi:MAG: hypothetical protein ACYTEZ_15210 [Planctomycetota bacterium]|jgi:hypothetical protein
MWRYVATAAIAVLLLAVALKSRQPADGGAGSPDGATTIANEAPEVSVVEVPGGRDLTVRHRFAGSVSRATLIYELDGADRTAAKRTDCQKVLENAAGLRDDGYATEVELSGRIPAGASHVRLVLEDETGTTVVPVELN